ncbi:MAG: hypothetical protein HS117_00855 [Verrucomicrobiaceae bacterium]|jgi:hypothetical protein|nr:hypothetical protein [Verrucomicrobiaceae bacterium]
MTRLLHLCALLLALGALPARAVTIDWGSSVGDVLLSSNGVPLDDSYIFELGSFGGFTPTGQNQGEWMAHWKPFDRAQAPAASGWNSAFSYFSSSVTMLDGGLSSASPPLPPYTFLAGEQAYIFVYNSLAFDGLSEWALVTNGSLDGNAANDWLMPAAGGKTDIPLEWRLSTASTVIHGGVNSVQGYGSYTFEPGTFDLQTHTVPEPSGVLLLAAATLRRRRRR